MTETQETGREAEAESSLDDIRLRGQQALAGELALEQMHEIRNALEALGYLTYLAAHEAADHAKVRKYMGMAEEEVVRMGAITSQTLGVARLAATVTPVNLVDLAKTALQLHQRKIERKRIDLRQRLPEEELVMEAQHGPLLQVLSNLIVNALEAMPEAGSLSVRLRKRKHGIDLIVADNGHGIEEQHLARLGERYFTTKGTAGNGLGLAISKRIVDDHRGTMRVRSSVRPGRTGTVFKVSLPTAETVARGTSRE